MIWLAWRQFRAQAALAAAATLAVVGVLLVTRVHVADSPDPGDLPARYQALRLLGTGLIGVPAFLGAFWGAPLVARELEAKTHRLAWTQSVTRARWLAAKLGTVAVVTVVLSAAFSSVFTWWSLPFDRLGNRVGTANFGQRGIAPIAYALFALVLGTLLGVVIRRTLPAMVATLTGFFVFRYVVQLFLRPHLFSPATVSRSIAFDDPQAQIATTGSWVLSTRTVDAAGGIVDVAAVENVMVQACRLTRASKAGDYATCADRLGFHEIAKVHPADRFWALQASEAALFLALTVVLVAVCFWWLRHRTA